MGFNFTPPQIPPNFDQEAFRRMVERLLSEGLIDLNWVDAPQLPCPDCAKIKQFAVVSFRSSTERERIAAEAFKQMMRRATEVVGREAYLDGIEEAEMESGDE